MYEKREADLFEERRILLEQNEERRLLLEQNEDVASVAQQLKGLEDVVQELEEGLEDARRGEAEARGEVEFLRGEVERVRAELRGEREKNAALVNGVGHISLNGRVDGHGDEYRESGGPLGGVDHSEVGGSESAGNVTSISTGGDADKWCALCEGDGHDSISCPFEKGLS